MKSSILIKALGLLAGSTSCYATMTVPNSLLLSSIAESVSLPMFTWSANGTHTAKGYTSRQANETSVQGMKEDCDNINLNKKIAVDFRSDVFGPGVIGFFYKCEKIRPDTNLYWFTISSGNGSQIDQLCDTNSKYPIVYDSQHNTWFIDEPFDCTQRTSPANIS
ncbi:hypothetical protein N7462_005362 [Penicillium macrosclerotiorum]|uniref:uncharacterized protein n=1 Tax=Penicillium macrosclerotiorum TaxID=303699 RepID=UPI002548E96F|nr:uncharacterized protein N7462_005362 [Penicillium macrosclerotiorum]KAJ5682197.1 hypothetical protein N7462_005362 [Penicillium macrosclerotiorum]